VFYFILAAKIILFISDVKHDNEIIWGHVEEILLLNNFSHCRYMP